MRRATVDKGFWLSFLINFAFRYQWGILAVLLFVLHLIVPQVPLYLCFIVLGIWVLHAFLITLVLTLIARAPSDINKPRPNRNPYSKKTSEYLHTGSNENSNDTDDFIIEE